MIPLAGQFGRSVCGLPCARTGKGPPPLPCLFASAAGASGFGYVAELSDRAHHGTLRHMKTEAHLILDVKVVRCSTGRGLFEWQVLESDGMLLEASTCWYATEQDAQNAGNTAAREIQRLVWHA